MSKRLFHQSMLWGLVALIAAAQPVSAQTIMETQRLNFGTWLIPNNLSNYTITLNADGSYTHSPQIVELSGPQVGEYAVTGLPAFATIVSVTVTMTQALLGPPGPAFTMDNFDTLAPDANGAGETTILLGARAVTSGNGVRYGDGLFAGELTLMINL